MSVDALIASYEAKGTLEERRLKPPFCNLDRSELAVARWLLWRYHEETGKCNPSDADIVAGTGLSERVVRRARNGLRDRGLIGWQERRVGGRRGSNEYDLPAILAACSDLPANCVELPAKSVTTTGQNGNELPANMAGEKNYGKEEGKENEKKASPDGSADLISLSKKKEEIENAAEAAERQRLLSLRVDLAAQLEAKPGHGPTLRALESLDAELLASDAGDEVRGAAA